MRKLMFMAVLGALLIPAAAVAQTPPIGIPELPVVEGAQTDLRVSNARPHAGETITVDGTCAAASTGRTVNFLLDGKTLPTTADSDSRGAFTARIAIPEDQPEGPATLTAECTGSGERLTTQLEIQRRFQAAQAAETGMRVSNASPRPGETITVDGTCGPTSADQTVNFFLDGDKLQTTANSNDQGAFTAQIAIPENRSPGPATLTAECTGNGQRLTTQLQIQAAQAAPAPVPTPRRIEAGAGGAAPQAGPGGPAALLAAGLATGLLAGGLVAVRRRHR